MLKDKVTVPGSLYVVATPIGNLSDLSVRAEKVLREVDTIAAEDTRRANILLQHLGIKGRVLSCHEHNETGRAEQLLQEILSGQSVALISDAGTPLISDPGYRVVVEAREQGIPVYTVAGPSAVIAALSISGLATNRFSFYGFLSSKKSQRVRQLSELSMRPETSVFFEASRRIAGTLSDMADIFGGERAAFIGRELTKRHESSYRDSLAKLAELFSHPGDHLKGEFVVCVAGAEKSADNAAATMNIEILLSELMAALPVKQAVDMAVRVTGQPRNQVYKKALSLKSK